MDGPSRGAWAHALSVLHRQQPRTDVRALATELFEIGETIDGTAKLRRALSDPSRDAWPKRELARRLFGGKISAAAMEVLEAAVSGRWVSDPDLIDAIERLGIDSVLAAAEQDGRLDQVEEELFRFERLVSSDNNLREGLGSREASGEAKATLVRTLLEGKVSAEALWLAQRPVLHARGRKYSAAIWRQLRIAADRRRQITAIVTSAIPLDATQKERLGRALTKAYGREVFVQVAVDPNVMGGIHVRVGDEVVDGTIVRRLEDARRTMGG